ncbi:MAG: hypothetical protein CM15mP3_02860 [Candidatus Poseidoniales archaeon]|nr:MAG: hypothetical protein CM15mP3_02860 [Candidatus Poseidoniales archaeon]
MLRLRGGITELQIRGTETQKTIPAKKTVDFDIFPRFFLDLDGSPEINIWLYFHLMAPI